jgi:transcription antitermination factor NusG
MSNPTEFLPGDRVKVIDGTFVGKHGVVVSLAEARALWRTAGGEQPPLQVTPGVVCVLLPIFTHCVPVCLVASQLEAADDQ